MQGARTLNEDGRQRDLVGHVAAAVEADDVVLQFKVFKMSENRQPGHHGHALTMQPLCSEGCKGLIK